MYLAKYAHQDAVRLEQQPTAKLKAWANEIERLMEEEQEKMEHGR